MPDQPILLDIKKSVVSGSIWSFIQVVGERTISFSILIYLAHVLPPEDFGVVAVAGVFAELLSVLVRAGLPEVIIRQESLTESQVNTAFWANLGFGVAGSVLLIAAAGPISSLFSLSALDSVLPALSPVILLAALAAVPEGRMRRHLRFRALAVRSLSAIFAGGAVAVGCAMAGYGIWSLVAIRVVYAAVLTCLLWLPLDWRPRLRFRGNELADLMRTSRSLVPLQLIGFLNMRAMDLLIGFLLGAAALGYFRLAWQGMMLGIQLTVGVLQVPALPTFARLTPDNQRLSLAYVRLTQICGLATFPLLIGVAAIAPQIVTLVYGDLWLPSGQILRILCLSVVPVIILNFASPLLVAVNQSGKAMSFAAVQVGLGISLVVLLAPFGNLGAATGLVLRGYVILPYVITLIRDAVGIVPSRLVKALGPSLAAAVVTGGVMWAVSAVIQPSQATWPATALVVLIGPITYVGILFGFARRFIAEVRDALRLALPTPWQRWV